MISATTFCYGANQIAAVYDEHVCAGGRVDTEIEYMAREREHGTPSSGYRPALYLPGNNRLVVITDQCFGRESNARAWIADQIRLIAIARKRQKESQSCAN
ncbi:hypothetical protein [Salinicola avicenniae]|uniref:hypothetical protein n=1 Tax=Salinicola avicenniae TaxID=2916836 RepID=UPI002074A2B3|nr:MULTISPECIES: hypothetical protein [unclassified Salinicola]